jgi:beta-phosphoglucomutase-like phosphatase (HAD superfamily)
MLKAVIFDFDGVIADTEPLHLKSFQLTLEEKGMELSEEEYARDYLAYDDKTFFKEFFKDRNFEHDEYMIEEFIARKSHYFNNILSGNILIMEGVPDFISMLGGRFPLSIGSGAFRSEIVEILKYAGLREYFDIIVSADDVVNCKPDPEVFLKVLEQLNQMDSVNNKIETGDCLVIEDSVSGVEAACLAGMKCLAVTNSYDREKLSKADLITDSLKTLSIRQIEELFY